MICFRFFLIVVFVLVPNLFQEARADVVFSQGFAVVNGVTTTSLAAIYPSTLIVCDSICIFSSNGKFVRLDFPGFGSLEEILKVTAPETSVDHLVTSVNGKYNFSIGDMQIKKIKKLDVVKSKHDNPVLDEPLANDPQNPQVQDFTILGDHEPKNEYPKDGTLILHHHGGEVFVVPQKVCRGAHCELSVLLNGSTVAQKGFSHQQKAFVKFIIEEQSEGIVQWYFLDDSSKTEGAFEIRSYNASLISQALTDSRTIEILP